MKWREIVFTSETVQQLATSLSDSLPKGGCFFSQDTKRMNRIRQQLELAKTHFESQETVRLIDFLEYRSKKVNIPLIALFSNKYGNVTHNLSSTAYLALRTQLNEKITGLGDNLSATLQQQNRVFLNAERRRIESQEIPFIPGLCGGIFSYTLLARRQKQEVEKYEQVCTYKQ